MTFHFKLETLLSYRKIREEQAHQALAREQEILEEHLQRLTELRAARMELIATFETRKKSEKLLPVFFAFHMDQLEYKERETRDRQRLFELQKESVARAQLAFAETVKQRKIIEKAREKAHHEYVQEYLRREQSENDEHAVLRHGRTL